MKTIKQIENQNQVINSADLNDWLLSEHPEIHKDLMYIDSQTVWYNAALEIWKINQKTK